MSHKPTKSAAELESMITAELREHPECESAGVEVIRPTGVAWDAALVGDGPQLNIECKGGSPKSPLGFARSSIWLNSCNSRLVGLAGNSLYRLPYLIVELHALSRHVASPLCVSSQSPYWKIWE